MPSGPAPFGVVWSSRSRVRWYRPRIMSCVGMVTGLPSAGLRMLFVDSIRIRASACASADSGRGNAIWAPSKSALNAGKLQVTRNLVTVEVRVERGADQRVDLDRLALDQLWLEGLDAEAVQRRRPVQQNRVLGDDLLEHVPHDRAGPLHHPLGRLDVLRVVEVNQALHHERLEQLQRHLLGQTALVQLELRADHDDRTAGV